MGKKEGQGENRISGIGVTARLIGITMGPIIAILIILTFISAKDMRDSMRTTQYQGMAGMAGSVQSAYNIVYQGDFKLDEKTGVLYKGQAELTKTNEMMDMLVEKSGYDMLLTYGDKIEITTMKGKNGERIIGQKIKDQVIIDKVLKGGKEYKDNDTKINGVEYYSYSLPVKNTDGTVVGVISIVNPRSEIDDYTQSRIMIIVVVAVVLLINYIDHNNDRIKISCRCDQAYRGSISRTVTRKSELQVRGSFLDQKRRSRRNGKSV